MGFRFYKSVSLGKGVRLGISKSGIGASIGGSGFRYSVHSSGRTRKSVGIPGSGLRYETYGSLKGSSRQTRPVTTAHSAPPLKAPLFAPRSEKRYVAGVKAFVAQEFEKALTEFSAAVTEDLAMMSGRLLGGICATNMQRTEQAIEWLEPVIQADEPLPDSYMTRYVPTLIGQPVIGIPVTPSVTVGAPLDAVGAALLLAELYERTNQIDKAIGLLENLVELAPENPAIALSLSELYFQSEFWDELATMPTKIDNTDDLSAEVLRYRARGLRECGMNDGALEVLKEALKSKKRHPEILKAARYERGLTYEALGKPAQARKDNERLYAEDPSFEDLAERLQTIRSLKPHTRSPRTKRANGVGRSRSEHPAN